MKRNKHITVNLTDEEINLLNKIAELYERKPSELARILLNRATLAEWQNIQSKEHPENLAPFSVPKFPQ